jgi:prepilin-type N-terminal cleavage/methylation domain-containing protein
MRALKGFTLIELLVVITIIGVTLGVVGPFSEQQVARAKSMEEWIQFQALLQSSAQNAFLHGQKIEVLLDGKQCIVWRGDHKTTNVYDYIFFPRQTVRFNQHGMTAQDTVQVVVHKNTRTISLKQPGTVIEAP